MITRKFVISFFFKCNLYEYKNFFIYGLFTGTSKEYG
jgi:hypothetical protein